jgi:hypothetical protein
VVSFDSIPSKTKKNLATFYFECIEQPGPNSLLVMAAWSAGSHTGSLAKR